MATKTKSIFIIRDETVNADNYEELQSSWLDELHPDKTIIGGEKSGEFLVNEENDAMICMEYISQ